MRADVAGLRRDLFLEKGARTHYGGVLGRAWRRVPKLERQGTALEARQTLTPQAAQPGRTNSGATESRDSAPGRSDVSLRQANYCD